MIYPFIAIFIPVLLFYMIYQAHHDKIRYHRLVDESLPISFDGYTVFFISDIHRRKIRKKTLKEIKENIDIVIIGGDLTEKGVPFRRVQENLRKLKGLQAPIFFVWGNNDLEVNLEKLTILFNKEEIHVLEDEFIEIKKGEDSFRFVGLHYFQSSERDLDNLFPRTVDTYVMMAVHVPDLFLMMPNEIQRRINTVLAGHTHGGQIRIFGLGPYDKGYTIKYKNTNILVSEGYGYSALPLRLGTHAECHVISFFHH